MSSGLTSTVTERFLALVCSPTSLRARWIDGVDLDRLLGQRRAAGLDARHVEDVVDHRQEIFAARADVGAVFLVLVGAERAEDAALHHLGEADDGVERRAQLVAHVGQELGLGAVGALGLGLLVEIALGEIGELVRLRLELLARLLEVENGRDELLLGLDEAMLVALERGDVGADRDVAAVLGAALVDLQPAAVLQAGLEGAGAHILLLAAQELVLHFRRAAERHHLRIGLALELRVGRKLVQLLEFRVAEHEVVVGVPEHEGLGDRLDGVVQARVGLGGLLFQAALLGHVDGDADEMARRVVRIVHQLGAGAQPHPVAA